MANDKVAIRLSDKEREAYRAAAARDGYDRITTWLRRLGDLHTHTPMRNRPEDIRRELVELRHTVNRGVAALENSCRDRRTASIKADLRHVRDRINELLR